MKSNHLRDVFPEQLKRSYNAEKQVIAAASPSEVKKAFAHHLEVIQSATETVRYLLDAEPETRQHVRRAKRGCL